MYLKLIFIVLMFTASCSKEDGTFLYSQGFVPNNVIVATSGNTLVATVALYDLNGNLLKIVRDFRDNGLVHAAWPYSATSLAVALESPDRIEIVNYDGSIENTLLLNANFNGYVYEIVSDLNYFYVTEAHRIERVDYDGNHDDNWINTTVGGCTMNGVRQMDFTPTGQLVATSFGNQRILTYDISGASPSCSSSVATPGTLPYGVLVHSNGDLYFSQFSDDQIYRANLDGSGAAVIFATDTSVINNPTAMIELPNGNILVSSSGNGSLEIIDENGNHVGTFANDYGSLNITDLHLITEDSY